MLHPSESNQVTARLLNRDFVTLCLQSFVLYVSFYILLPTLPLYQQQIGGQIWEVGALATVFTVASVLARGILGQAVDRWGRRTFLLGGMAIYILAVPLYLAASTIPSEYPLRVLHGLGWAAATTASSALAADLAPAARRGEALGYFVAMPVAALAVGPQIGLWLVGSFGFGAVLAVAALIGLCAATLALRISDPRRSGEEDVEPLTIRHFVNLRVKRPSLAILSVNITYAGVVIFIPLYFQHSPQSVALFYLVFALTILLVRPLSGRLSDAVGRQAIILPGLVVAAIGFALMGASDSVPILLLSSFIYALSFGAIYPSLMALAVDLVSQHERGVAMGTFMAAFDAGIAVGSLLLGFVAQHAGYRDAFWIGSLVPVGGLVYFVIATHLSVRARRARGM